MHWYYGQGTASGGGTKGKGRGAPGPAQMFAKGPPFGKGGTPLALGGKDAGGSAHSNVFVGNLPEDMTQAALERAFAPHGQVESCSVMTKAGRTYGFVKFATVASTARAIATLNGQAGWLVKLANNDTGAGTGGAGKGPGGSSKVQHSNVFVGNLDKGITEAALEQVFAPYGKLNSVAVMSKEEQTYGFAEFSTIVEAERAIQALSGRSGWLVRFANNDMGPARLEETVQHSNVFVGNLAEDVTENSLREVFGRHGTVQSCIVVSDKEGGRNYGFVKYHTIAAAGRAIAALDGLEGANWTVKCANNDSGKGGAAGGKGWYGKGGKGGWPAIGWVWQPSGRTKGGDRPEPAPHENLYVKDLPPGITEDEVHSTFSKVGQVLGSRVLRWDDMSGCAALVRMANTEQAVRAKASLNGTVLESCLRPLTCTPQEKAGQPVEDHVYIKGLHFTTSRKQLSALFGRFGTVKWSRVLPLPFPSNPANLPDCTALVQMSSPEEAQYAMTGLNGQSPALGTTMTVTFAEIKPNTQRPEPEPNNNLYVKGWPVGFPDFLLQQEFQQYGNVVRLRLLDNPDPEQPTCAALVQMSRVEEAVVAVRALHGRTVNPPLPPMRVRYAGKDQMTTDNLYVTSLPRTITENEVRKTFQKYGEVVRLRLLVQQGTPETHALVQLSSQQLAAAAIKALDGTSPGFKGATLDVTYAARREAITR